ncbi:MAG: hypothetical protein R2791_11180 [Saprospiraceae bacterium]
MLKNTRINRLAILSIAKALGELNHWISLNTRHKILDRIRENLR